jgi:hypothetical protein
MINNRLGFSFPSFIVVGGGLLTFSGFVSSIENLLIGISMILAGPFFWSSHYGIQINTKENKFREYVSMYGIKKGKWQSLDYTPFISVLKSRSGTRVYSSSSHSTTNMSNSYDVCLLNKTHRKKFVLKKFDSKHQAEKYAENISSKLNKSFVDFNPTISAKTRSRRR